MTRGPRDEDLDVAFDDDRRHLEHYGFGLTTDADYRNGIEREDELDQDDDEEGLDS